MYHYFFKFRASRVVTTRVSPWKKKLVITLELSIIHMPLIAAIVMPGLFIVFLSNIMSSVLTAYLDPQKFIYDFVDKGVEHKECYDVCKIILLPTHNITLQNITILSPQQKVTNITIVNSQNILVFVKLNSNQREIWVSTFYDTRITALFTGNLSVEIFPFSAFSDANSRKLFFQEGGNRTVYVSSQLGSIINQIFSAFLRL